MNYAAELRNVNTDLEGVQNAINELQKLVDNHEAQIAKIKKSIAGYATRLEFFNNRKQVITQLIENDKEIARLEAQSQQLLDSVTWTEASSDEKPTEAPAEAKGQAKVVELTPTKEEATEEEKPAFTVETNEAGVVTLENSLCRFVYKPAKKDFSGDDLTDPHNAPRCYNTNKRSHKRAAKALIAGFNEKTDMYAAMKLISRAGVAMRSYCSMD